MRYGLVKNVCKAPSFKEKKRGSVSTAIKQNGGGVSLPVQSLHHKIYRTVCFIGPFKAPRALGRESD